MTGKELVFYRARVKELEEVGKDLLACLEVFFVSPTPEKYFTANDVDSLKERACLLLYGGG